MRSMVEGRIPDSDRPSTALRSVPLPEASSGRNFAAAVRPIAIVQAALVGLSFLALIQLFLRTDLSVAPGRGEQPFDEAVAVQIRRGLGKPRRLDAAVGDGAGDRRRRRGRCSSGGCPSGP